MRGANPAVIGSVNVLAVAERGCGGSLWSPPRPFGHTASSIAGYLIPSGRRASQIKISEKNPSTLFWHEHFEWRIFSFLMGFY